MTVFIFQRGKKKRKAKLRDVKIKKNEIGARLHLIQRNGWL